MLKIWLIILLILSNSIYEKQDAKEKFEIQGKWYMKETVNIQTQEKLHISYIKCPYFDFNPEGEFQLVNGFNMEGLRSRWILIDSNIIITSIDHTNNDTTIFKIIKYEYNNMCLTTGDALIYLDRICENK